MTNTKENISKAIEAARSLQATNIVEIVSYYTKIKQKGNRWIGLSPFNREKTPSFVVSPSIGIFKDFSSGNGGDGIRFVMLIEKCSFVDACIKILQILDIKIEQDKDSEEYKLSSQLEAFYNLFPKSDIEIPKEYGVVKKVVNGFHTQINVTFNAEHIQLFDFCANRIIYPLYDRYGSLVGLNARALGDEKPKYIHSPDSCIFSKDNYLYGLNVSYKEIKESKEALICEGVKDCHAFFKQGIKNIVGTLGTSITTRKLNKLPKECVSVTICYDSDKAGNDGVIRGIGAILSKGLIPYVCTFPEGEDPDSLHEKGIELVQFIETKKCGFMYLIDKFIYENKLDTDKAESVLSFYEYAKSIVYQIPKKELRDFYTSKVKDKYSISISEEETTIKLSSPAIKSFIELIKEAEQVHPNEYILHRINIFTNGHD